jgi:extracellular factor (EF) 3-hydroxypalmitic acid methyl ester biosynthesis protein
MDKRTEDFPLGLRAFSASLRKKIKLYKRKAAQIEAHLTKSPDEWGKFQSDFNTEINDIFIQIMDFERRSLLKGETEKVDKLKRIFIKYIRRTLLRGAYPNWSFEKPYGYPGDFKIIDDIYTNRPSTTGYERLFDNYFLMLPISIAVRNRKEDFKKLILDFIHSNHKQGPIRIMNLACGSCREIYEMLINNPEIVRQSVFDCYDSEPKALEFSTNLLAGFPNVNFYSINALRISATKHVSTTISKTYHCIYSTGLFDYLNHRISVRMVANLRNLLAKGGKLIIANVRDRYSNPSLHSMEWLEDWNLVYRTDEEFKEIFIEAGFKKQEIKIEYENQGLLQYVIASRSK